MLQVQIIKSDPDKRCYAGCIRTLALDAVQRVTAA